MEWYQGGLKPEPPRGYVDLTDVGNGAIFEGSKGFIFCDFVSRVIIPSNDDGDMTYYKRRSKDQLLPLVGRTGTPSPPPRPSRPRTATERRSGGFRIPMGSDGFPAVELLPGDLPPALGLPNPGLEAIQEGRLRPSDNRDAFMLDWVYACKGQSDNLKFGTSSKTHCDFDYSGTMMEQMLFGLVAHRAGKKLRVRSGGGTRHQRPRSQRLSQAQYRPGWTLNG